MKQTFVIWLCLAALVISNAGCPKPTHTTDRIDNADRAAQYTVDMEKCYQSAVETVQTTGNRNKAQSDYTVCEAEANAKAHRNR